MPTRTFTGWLFALTLAFSLVSSVSYAQSLKLGAGGGLLVLMPTNDQFTQPLSDGGYGFGPRTYQLDLGIKYTLPHALITFTSNVTYAPLKGSGTYSWVDAAATVPSGREYRADLYGVSIGLQRIFGNGTIRPYVGAHALWSIMGDVSMRKWGNVIDIAVVRDGSFSRIGVGFVGGTELDLASHFALDLAVCYTLTSPFHGNDEPYYRACFNTCTVGLSVLYEILP